MEKLRIYQTALDLIKDIYFLIRKNKSLSSDWSLCDQIKRASVSVLANIAEGYLRSHKQFRNYLQISSGSANEVVAHLQVISKVYEIPTEDLQESYRILARQIGAFSSKLI
ncbi:MAG TPA: four helix bundle protein [Alphaproteobacteria bacterium]|jgi:four helix bundle protein|nr:four helix bundle protein [Alphaproteobacteria bacterium]